MTVPLEPAPVTVVLSLGANLGDRLAALQTAVDLVSADPAVEPVSVSSVYETDPVGGPDQPDYLNAILVIRTTLVPVEVLALAAHAEQELNRVREVRWGARTLDVDVINYDEVVSDDPVLTLPHPRAAERAFVLVPLNEVAPTMRFAGAAAPISQLLAQCSKVDADGVRVRADLKLTITTPNPGSPI